MVPVELTRVVLALLVAVVVVGVVDPLMSDSVMTRFGLVESELSRDLSFLQASSTDP